MEGGRSESARLQDGVCLREILHLRPYFARYRRQFVIGGAALVIANVVTLLGPWVMKYAVDDITRAITAEKIGLYAGLLVVIAAVQGFFRYHMRSILIGASRLIEYDLRNDMFRRLLALDAAYYARTKTGDIMSRATNDLNAVRMFLGPGIMYSMGTFVTFVVALAFMLRIDVRLTLFALVPLPVLAFLTKWLGEITHRGFEQVQEENANVAARVQENLSGIRVVKAFAQEDAEIEDFRKANEKLAERNLSLVNVWGMYFPMMALVAGIAAVIVLAYGGREVIRGGMTFGDFVAFNGYLGLLTWPTIALGWVTNLLHRGAASMGRIQTVLDEPLEITGGSREIGAPRGEVEFRDITFRYPDGVRGLSEVSFRARPGMTIAVVGATGSGKSTLIELLPRQRDAQSGEILVDGADTRELPLPALRRAIGMVPQDPFLFSDTIRENIGYALADRKSPAAEARIIEAAKAAGVWGEIESFPNGLDTLLGERGVNLSGGQKQRVTLARALAADPPILVLDDALSSVDTETEALILRNLRRVFAGRTNIVISHRLSMVQEADLILVLEGGRIAERGTHRELLASGRVYPKIYERELLKQELDKL
jgi:ATP-binding cassette subfamily B protein